MVILRRLVFTAVVGVLVYLYVPMSFGVLTEVGPSGCGARINGSIELPSPIASSPQAKYTL